MKALKLSKNITVFLRDCRRAYGIKFDNIKIREIHLDRKPSSKLRRNILYGISISSIGLVAGYTHYRLNGKSWDELTGKSELKNYTKDEVAKHNSLETGVWVTYKGMVYDITDFVEYHPGGTQTIMMGAGGDVEPFWQTYTVHQAEEVQNLLAKYQIGILQQEEQSMHATSKLDTLHSELGPYSFEPERNPDLAILSKEPFNAETPSKRLISTSLTPVATFFVRNHLPVPEVDLDDYTFTVCFGNDGDTDGQRVIAQYTLDDLKKNFKPHTIRSVIQCSGNRRSELKNIKEIKGLNWNVGAIGNAEWTGVRLVDLFESLGIKPSDSIKHIQVEGLDCDMSGQAYGASISADVAFEPNRDVLLAYEMNGEPLNRDHGFPLRFVAPGITGARNVKWLSKLILSHEESSSHWQRNDYKSFSPNVDMFSVNYNLSISIQEMPVQSAICDPIDDEVITIKKDTGTTDHNYLTIPVSGYAYSGGGKAIIRVDISTDGGSTWLTADLIDQPRKIDGSPEFNDRNRSWSWTRWSLNVPVSPEIIKNKKGQLEILCRAFDSSYNSQPERPETIWNLRGVVNNSWHKIRLNVNII